MQKILVVVDMQKDFVDGSLGSPEAVSIVPAVAEKIRNFDGDIFVTYDTHNEDYLQTQEGLNLPVKHCIKGTPGWEIDSNVLSALSERSYTAVEKPTFGSVELAKFIMEKYGCDHVSIELIGLCTDICVVSNALLLKAFFPEAMISVDTKCCAVVTPELHEAAVATMKSCQIKTV